MTATNLQDLPLSRPDLFAAYAAGLHPREVVEEVFRRIDALADPGIFLHLFDRETLAAAADTLGEFDPHSKPLWGLPFAVKDNIDVAGAPTTAACPAFEYRAAADAFVVAQARRAGAILIGKTNLDQFATGLVGVRTPHPIPRNALDPELIPGGSSSGSAVAVAAGLVSFAFGTDTAGSGRVPAAMNGIAGIKPTLGALSMTGVVPACRTLDTVSVFASDVASGYDILRAVAGVDATDPYSRPVALGPMPAQPGKLRVGVPSVATREFFGDDDQRTSFEAAVETLSENGTEIVEIDFSRFYEVAALLYDGAWVAERYTVVGPLMREDPEAVHPVTRTVVGKAEQMSAADAFEDFYRLKALARQLDPQIDSVDVLCVPTIPTLYTLDEVAADPVGTNTRLGTYTNFVNLLDLCGVTVPRPQRADGRPASITLLARAGHDGVVARLAASLEGGETDSSGSATHVTESASTDPAIASDEVELAVVGAHMRDLPLNHELTRVEARFLRQTRTAPCYRLYRLEGDAPMRPGMVRDTAPGAAIELEVWALPRTRLADFMAGIPSPLCIGNVELADGHVVKGFLCESAGLGGAEDISRHRGWRYYLSHLEAASQPASRS